MKMPNEKTKEELTYELELIRNAYAELSKNYEILTQEAKELRQEIAEVNASAINFENKVQRILGKEALGAVLYGSKEAYERRMALEDKLHNAKTLDEKKAAFEDLLAYESDDPNDQKLFDEDYEK